MSTGKHRTRERLFELYIPKKHAWVARAVREVAEREMRSVSNVLLRAVIEYLRDWGYDPEEVDD